MDSGLDVGWVDWAVWVMVEDPTPTPTPTPPNEEGTVLVVIPAGLYEYGTDFGNLDVPCRRWQYLRDAKQSGQNH